jgi:GalNAc-alpha-(1->4)-GalNAc-alpha-(1->3)-diNAcBac-PP-undecaprenol alpha-1,4-N-acetyl-D-galactosaminyltransferase
MPNFGYQTNIFSKLIYSLRIIFYLRSKVNTIKPDSVLSFGEGYNSMTILSLLGLKVRTYVSDRSSPLHQLNFLNRKFMQALYPKADGVISQTQIAKEVISKKADLEKVYVVPNPVKIIQKVDEREENIILNLGRLVPEKNQLQLIRMFSNIENKDWKLIIVGEGPLRADLEKEIKNLKLESKVILAGAQYDLRNYFSKAKVFAFTSISEGYPNALCEAMAFPLPVISFNCVAGPSDIIENGVNGFLIEPNDNRKFEEKLTLLMQNEGLRQTFRDGAIKIRESHSISNIAQKVESIFKEGR